MSTRLPTVPPPPQYDGDDFIALTQSPPYFPRFEDVAAELGFTWPLPEFSHAQFLRDHKHQAWLDEWEVTLVKTRGLQALGQLVLPKPGERGRAIPVTRECPCGHVIRSHGRRGCNAAAASGCGCDRTQQRARLAVSIADAAAGK